MSVPSWDSISSHLTRARSPSQHSQNSRGEEYYQNPSSAMSQQNQAHPVNNLNTEDDNHQVLASLSVSSQYQVVLLGMVVITLYDSHKRPFQVRGLLDSGSQMSFVTEGLARRLNLVTQMKNLQITGIAQNSSTTKEITEIKFYSRFNKSQAFKTTCAVLKRITCHQPQFPINSHSIPVPHTIQLANPTFYKPAEIEILLGVPGLVVWRPGYILPETAVKRYFGEGVASPPALRPLAHGEGGRDLPYGEPRCPLRCLSQSAPCQSAYRYAPGFCRWRVTRHRGFGPGPWYQGALKLPHLVKVETHGGADLYFDLITDGNIRLGAHLPVLQNTHLGYVIAGKFNCTNSANSNFSSFHNFNNNYQSNSELTSLHSNNTDLTNLTKLNHFGKSKKVEQLFETTTKILPNGRYQMNLPLKSNDEHQRLGDSFTQAKRRFLNLKKRFSKDQDLFIKYKQFIDEYISLGHANYIPLNPKTESNNNSFFLPHHCVLRNNSVTTKLRVVFDGSMKSSTGVSLNELTLKGYTIQPELFDILIKFRTFRYVFTADIEKMFRQILINPNQRFLQNILWRNSPEEPLRCIELATVTYGTNCAPFLSKAFLSLQDIALKNKDRYLLAKAHTQITKYLDTAHIKLHKWSSNSPEFLKALAKENSNPNYGLIPESSSNKVLGLSWNPNEDNFHIIMPHIEFKETYTKRQVLSTIASIYDPIGVINPVVVFAKIIIAVSCNLLSSKSRVAPLKVITLPKLERMAAVLLSDLKEKIVSLQSNPSRWSTHIRSKENPADIISRGSSPNELILSDLWWSGPTFLQDQKTDLNKYNYSKHELEIIPEERKITAHIVQTSWSQTNNSTVLESKELCSAEQTLIKIIQLQYFSAEIEGLKNKQPPFTKSIQKLAPFLCEKMLLRVGGRLSNAPVPHNQKYPIFLPSKCHLVRLLLKREYIRLLHCGPQTVLSNIRLRYWPLDGLREIKRITQRCLTCYRLRATAVNQIMAHLPKERLQVTRPFTNVGIDYGGPYTIKTSKLRRASSTKCYMAVFVCLSTRAVHIELVSDLSTDAFLLTIKRFISRRDTPATIFSDNAKNFLGARNQLKSLYEFFKSSANKEAIQTFASENQISWKFIPPRAPHHGGMWEAAIKGAKYHLITIVGNLVLTFEEMSTILTQIEAVLNSRTLCPLSNDPADLNCLTPGHFLIGSHLITYPETDFTTVSQNRLSIYKRPKWFNTSPNICLSEIILLKDEQTPPVKWPLARVIEVFPGRDNRVRVAKVKTQKGEYTRAIPKICRLPTTHSGRIVGQLSKGGSIFENNQTFSHFGNAKCRQ
ncbi:uncharacterized protein [Euwallacea similis]|uniref:uncharacterized protein n=1 Tax=Euwallacea similis TaxID=1736056 RepID=UPI00344E90CE